MSKIGRNDPCPCGSGKKYKKCCLRSGFEEPTPPNPHQVLGMIGSSSPADDPHDQQFNKVRSSLEALFTAYSAEDVILTLGVSDLWLPNISSQIKHLFAFGIFAAISPNRFKSESRVKDYETFCEALTHIHELLPSFPMLEDYVPEADWGEVKSYWQGRALRLFYGTSLERVPDYIEAFRLTNADKQAALDDMFAAVLLQDSILTSIDKSLVGDIDGISPGHIEIPPEPFWQVCRATLFSVGTSFTRPGRFSSELVVELGKSDFPKGFFGFGEALMTGKLLPALFVKIGELLFPVAPRCAVTNIVDFWGHRAEALPFRGHYNLTQQVSEFLASRIAHGTIIRGPFWVRDENRIIPTPFAAFLRGDSCFYFVVILSKGDLERLPAIEAELLDLVTRQDWGIQIDGTSQGLQFSGVDGNAIKPDVIVILAALPQESTEGSSFIPPETKSAQILPIADLVSIFDSIKDLSEFDRFWAYIKANQGALHLGLLSLTDKFAAFRYSHGVLIDGAIEPNLVMIDPHSGSNWRYEELTKFWSIAPACFPNDDPRSWVIEPGEDGILDLTSKAQPTQAWAMTVSGCTLLLVHHIQLDLDNLDIRVLELFTHCVADAIYRRRGDFENADMFRWHRIIVEFRANTEMLASRPQVQGDDMPLLQGWEQIDDGSDDTSVRVGVSINLSSALAHFEDPVDNSFEVSCACSILEGMAAFLGEPMDAILMQKVRSVAPGKPRFMLSRSPRIVDVPDFVDPQKPRPDMFKLARKAIAIIFKEHGIEPGRFELDEAKRLIDLARNAFRDQLHKQIGRFNKNRVLSYCVAQHDAWSVKFQRTRDRLEQSLRHEVSYDRQQAFADAHHDLVTESRNLRFLLESSLSLPSTQDVMPSDDDILQLLAHVDWLLVLYSASDALHNGIATGGIEISEELVPNVFYSDQQVAQEEAFNREQASYSLGIDLDSSADTMPQNADNGYKEDFDAAFLRDTQFSFSHMMDALSVLMQWETLHGRSSFQLSYRETKSNIVQALCSFIDGISADEADSIVQFLSLRPTEIRRLIGKDVDEGDVPIWEHKKRGGRYTIKPLVPLDQDILVWGAASAQNAQKIWAGNVMSGYLPADYDWPSIQKQVRTIKQAHEKGLEHLAFEIVSNYTSFSVKGIDFNRRFPEEKFDDVGDFDVLAYWPQEGKWLVGECKYNQPPFCPKDARRLRERIFGISPDRGQFAKIERRRAFLSTNMERLRELLKWPAPTTSQISIDELYISKEIYWWMRFPPYEVSTQFVRIDGLDFWMMNNCSDRILALPPRPH